MSESRFRVDAENVVHETVDGELIAIDLANGSYYSLSGSGPAIWELLAGGASATEIAATLEARFEAEPGVIEAAAAELLAELRAAELIVPAEGSDLPPTANARQNGEREAFVRPVFERYTDMKDYFLLDPIHEVDTAGWPRPAA